MEYGSSYRRNTFRRMVRRLESGVLPNQISGDRDILAAAMTHVQRQADVADDLPTGNRANHRPPVVRTLRGAHHVGPTPAGERVEHGSFRSYADWQAPYDA